MIIDCISDLHGFFPKLEGADLLIIAGDLTAHDFPKEHSEFCDWLGVQPYRQKIVIAGNHDNNIDADLIDCMHTCHYLEDCGIEFEGLKIWGSPWTRIFDGMNLAYAAFTLKNDYELKAKWDLIPADTDILVTHSPPMWKQDLCQRGFHAGSLSLFGWLANVGKPKLHVFGHVHEGYGQSSLFTDRKRHQIRCVNASHVDVLYKPVNKPIRIEL